MCDVWWRDQGALLCCAVLCCAVLCCAVLCSAVLCCAVPCSEEEDYGSYATQHLKLKSSICLKNYLFLSGNHETATKSLNYFGGMSSIVFGKTTAKKEEKR